MGRRRPSARRRPGVELLGANAATTPPGTEALGRVFAAAGAPVLVLFDEVLNFVNRYRKWADPFHAFIQNLTVAMTGTTHGAAVISLPRSQVEMSDFDLAWQDKITKVVRRVAKDLLANDETEVSEVVRRRLFDHIGDERFRKKVSRLYADWCFERRERLPPQWTLVDSAATEAKAREHLRARFEACYPFHPATLSVFQRKWNALPQFQQTRGTLAMLAQWISWAYHDGFKKARPEPLITLGSAPLDVSDFAGVVLGQLGESRLSTAIDADIAGVQAHAGPRRRQQGSPARHPAPRGNDDAVRVVGRAGGPGGPSARAALRARRTVHRDHLGRQRGDGPGGTLLLPAPRRPPALKADGAWPLVSLRQSFLDGSLTRLVDPDAVLRRKIVEFVAKGDFGLGSGRRADGRFERASFRETVSPEDVMFEADVHLLTRGLAERLKAPPAPEPEPPPRPGSGPDGSGEGPPAPGPGPGLSPGPEPPTPPEPQARKTLRIHGDIPPEVWNRVGTRLLTKLRTGGDLKVGVTFELTADGPAADALLADLRQILDDLQLTERVRIDVE